MASKRRARRREPQPAVRRAAAGLPPSSGGRSSGRPALSIPTIVAILVFLAIVVIGAELLFTYLGGSESTAPTTPRVSASTQATVTNVSADQLAQMLGRKDFTLLNVKTPYIGEIEGTDLYIPYDRLRARVSELPADRGTKIVVYCRSGVQSAQAAQTLLDLGYTNVWNLDGGMNAWQAAGGTLVNEGRT